MWCLIRVRRHIRVAWLFFRFAYVLRCLFVFWCGRGRRNEMLAPREISWRILLGRRCAPQQPSCAVDAGTGLRARNSSSPAPVKYRRLKILSPSGAVLLNLRCVERISFYTGGGGQKKDKKSFSMFNVHTKKKNNKSNSIRRGTESYRRQCRSRETGKYQFSYVMHAQVCLFFFFLFYRLDAKKKVIIIRARYCARETAALLIISSVLAYKFVYDVTIDVYIVR